MFSFCARYLLGLSSSKYFYTPFMLTPSPNLDTDVLLPPPSFTLHQASHHVRPRASLLATRHHPIRKSSIFSDMDDTSPGDSVDDIPVVPTHTTKSYPGVAIPVVQRSLLEVGSDGLTDRSILTKRSDILDSKRLVEEYEKVTRQPISKFFSESYTSKEKSKSSEGSQMNSSHSLDELELTTGLTVDYLQDKVLSAPPSRGTSPSIIKPVLIKSHSASKREPPAKSEPIPIPRKVFTSHNRSKSSGALKPEKAYEIAQTKSARDDISLLQQRDTSLTTAGSSSIYELLSKKTHISPSHTEMCLSYMPKKAEMPSSWERSRAHRHGEHLYTSRSLERPSTPKHNKHLSSIHKHSSLPLQQSRDRSPSPVRTQNHWRLERQYAQFTRDPTCDLKDVELGKLRRTLTHEEEINLIISGDPKYLTKLKSPESFTPPEIPDAECMLMPEKQYEMKF
ncbi:hypothetical protein Pcinc_030130 [Petrolisthes cinctipes]|uniref:Uncharacterized protein n=1 Tax=Petrolisthes cinctipes TaxID=88211 RepID=A0AAE1K6R8_PETCI|nr:hypothetical protein Pcinc_030130 [Petrolisthes cinctipes]